MLVEKEPLTTALQQALEHVAAQQGHDLAKAITPIVMANLDKGRVHYFLDEQNQCQPEDYVQRVADFYQKWQPYLHQIQQERSPELWLPLYDRLKRWAYRFLSSKSFSSPGERAQLALDCAATAATRLLNARFPYDTDFDPWAAVLLKNVTMKHLHQAYEEAAANLLQVDDWEALESVLPAFANQGHRNKVEIRQALLAAIAQLASDARKQVILLHYFEGLPLQQIAEIMGRSENATHKLHFDALKNLRKIWESNGDTYE